MVILLIADTTAIQIIPAAARSYTSYAWLYINFWSSCSQYDKDVIVELHEVVSPCGVGFTFTLNLELGW